MFGIKARSTVVVGLLALAVMAVYAPDLLARVQSPGNGPAYVYVTDLDFWQRTQREQTVTARVPLDLSHDLTTQIPLQLGPWQGEDVPQSNIEVFILLEPEQYVQRLYRDNQDHYVWLSLIGGRTSQPFHPPDLCYDADGWQTSMTSQAVALPDGGEIYGLWMEAEKAAPSTSSDTLVDEHLIFYFYLFPNGDRDPADGILLFKLTSPRYGTSEETLAVHQDLLGHFLAQVGASG